MANLLSNTPPALKLQLKPFNRVLISLVGCGGTGSHIASGLISLAGALDARGVRTDVLLYDPDIVEPRNVGRQLFSPADVGHNKAEALASRLNLAFGARVGAVTRAITAADTFTLDGALNVVVGAVDNPAARAILADTTTKAWRNLWHLDCGNENHSGQVAIGNIGDAKWLKHSAALGMIDGLPAPHLVYPDLIRAPKAPKTKKPARQSCAELTAAGEQGLMVNRMAAAWALAMLDALLVRGDLHYFAVAFDLAWGGTRSYAIDAPTIAEAVGLTAEELGPAKETTRPAQRGRTRRTR
jgi:PRTRC genetic system ThiF family protein